MNLNKIFSILISFLLLFLGVGCMQTSKTKEETKIIDETPTEAETDVEKTKTLPKLGDNETEEPTDYINPVSLTIYSINDFHGIIFPKESYAGISRIGKYLTDNKDENTIIISAGDMFQGSALSSMTRGKAVLDCMNYIGFDAMTIGNHEFDWGIDEIMKYQDGDSSNGEANFSFLCANCMDVNTKELASWCTPYTVVEKLGVKIGIIGIIGQGEESDILASHVRNYVFSDEITAIKKYTKILRTEEDCDLVILSIHADSSNYNTRLIQLSGEYRIDAILNGHTHRAYYGDYQRDDGSIVPYVQSGCYGAYLGKINIMYDRNQDLVIGASANNLKTASKCTTESEDINNILNNYSEYVELAQSILGTTKVTITKDMGGSWAADVLKEYTNADLGLCNMGGIRSNAFPMYANSEITYDNIFQVMPFENMIRVCELTGADILRLISSSYYLSGNVDSRSLTIDGIKIETTRYYKIATIDFVYEQDYLPFLQRGINRVDTGILFRDALVEDFKNNCKENGAFIR